MSLFYSLRRFSEDYSQGTFFSAREISSVVKLDVWGKLAYGILDGKF